MHALVIKSFRAYFGHVHGENVWAQIAQSQGYLPDDFELRIPKSVGLSQKFLANGAEILCRDREDILEDLGLFLTTHEATTALRRLLRFSGPDFREFLYGLPDLAPRAELAVPNLSLPRIDVVETPKGMEVAVRNTIPGFDHVLAGVIRGMADDYGALVHVEPSHNPTQKMRSEYNYWHVMILDESHSSGRKFTLTEDAT